MNEKRPPRDVAAKLAEHDERVLRLQRLCRARGFTTRRLAMNARVPLTELRDFTYGTHDLTLTQWEALAEALGVAAQTLLSGCACECHDGFGGTHPNQRCRCQPESFGDFDDAPTHLATTIENDDPGGSVTEDENEPTHDDAWAGVTPAFVQPPETTELPEPPVGTVIAYQDAAPRGTVLDYVTFRAGNGSWYQTGHTRLHRVTWPLVVKHLRQVTGPVRYATAWTRLHLETETPPVGGASQRREALLRAFAETFQLDQAWKDQDR